MENRRAPLKPQLRPERHPQVVVCAVVEENIVSDFGPNSNRPGESFDTTAGIDGEVGSSAGQRHTVGKSGGCVLIGDGEIVEPRLSRHENAEGPGSSLKLRPKKAMQRAKTRAHIDRCDAVGESVGVIPVEVVSHFSLNLNVGMNVKCGSTPKAHKINWRRGPGISEIIGKSTDLDVIGLALREQWHGGKKQ